MAAKDQTQNTEEEFMDEETMAEAMSVLAGSDAENCSYPQGYVKRQAVFACSTCTSEPNEPAGVCLACANKCHDGHDIIELYTKRNFRCDCGNRKFGEFKCQLIPSKDPENVNNKYSHNYYGLYCTCDKGYPDEEGQNGDEMIECVICEDWYHPQHLGCTVAEPKELEEMVCERCMNKAPFLWTYAESFSLAAIGSQEDEDVDVEDDKTEASASPSTSQTNVPREVTESPSSTRKRKREDEADVCSTSRCRLQELESRAAQRQREGAVFWPSDWRSQLCTCTSCKRAYVSAQVHFLLDPSDTRAAYERKGLEEPFGRSVLSTLMGSMSHTAQLEILYGFQEMQSAVASFLQPYASSGKEVTAEAIRQCFEELTEKRRRANEKK
ncbi:unnamed protein product [Knipowitschia caucasica]|uniref:UBR-type domain-containing protein n=1 Tax=Knipowitschia caucasica TaxID=637954 RepID=A0AAV2JGD3_KNICA